MKTRYERKVTMKQPITADEHEQLAAALVRIRGELADIERWLMSKKLRSWAGTPTRILRARNHLNLLTHDLIMMMAEDSLNEQGLERQGWRDPVETYLPGPAPQPPKEN